MEIKSKYKVGQSISFKRNDIIKSNNAKIIAVEQSHLMTISGLVPDDTADVIYVVENQYGFSPDEYRIKKYDLDKDKKYIFVKEKEIL